MWRHKSVAAFCQNAEDYKLGNENQNNTKPLMMDGMMLH